MSCRGRDGCHDMLVFSPAGHTLELEETTQISHRVEWIGWQSGFCAGIMQLKQEKCFKFLGVVLVLFN